MVVAELLLATVAALARTDYTEKQTEVGLTPFADIGPAEKEVDIDNSNCPLGNSGNLVEYFAPNAQVQPEASPYDLAAHGEPNALEQPDSGRVVQLMDSSSLAGELAAYRLFVLCVQEAAVTVGRVPEQADIVLSIATVSGTHARLEKKKGSLLVTDLDSTNGTYIKERRLTPGFPTPIDPGSLLIFGDIHLAMFRVSKMVVDVSGDTNGAEQEAETAQVSTATQQTN
ncbi:uncharacterized protein LOC127757328 [Oryza glaberrima]|uniref:uncharacterized protein LOC127757328 n=1 Tax=Oryza glaberrima TaxID=4538 RepID=UPI00224C07D9|nr:uncharacterized protein LOC127757328 [Oryza glaberrima]